MEHQKSHLEHRKAGRIYTLCSFDRGLVVPKLQLIDAVTDDEAIAFARSSHVCSLREVWDRHRLVAIIQPADLETAAF